MFSRNLFWLLGNWWGQLSDCFTYVVCISFVKGMMQ